MDLDDKCEIIMKALSDFNLTYKQLKDKTKFNDVTLSSHLGHLKSNNLIININKQYQKSPEKKYVTTPYTLTGVKINLEIQKRDNKFEYLHHKIIRQIKNETDKPLTGVHAHIFDEKVPRDWTELNIKYDIIKNNNTFNLYDKEKKPSHFREETPYSKYFRVDFADHPLYKGEEMTLIHEYDWPTAIDNTRFSYTPNVYTEYLEFTLTFPKKLQYELNVSEVNKLTLEEILSPNQPKKHKDKHGFKFKWSSSSSLSSSNFLDFRWKLI